MITMKVNAEVSKQGTVTNSTTNLPPTSEKIVTSEVRTKSGEPIIIGGLLQTELTENINIKTKMRNILRNRRKLTFSCFIKAVHVTLNILSKWENTNFTVIFIIGI